MSFSHEAYIKYKIERELEHLAWLKRNMPNSKRLISKSIARIKMLEQRSQYDEH